MNKTYSISYEVNWKHAQILVYLFVGARPRIFKQCVTIHPNNLVHLRLCKLSQGDQVGSVCGCSLVLLI